MGKGFLGGKIGIGIISWGKKNDKKGGGFC